MRRRLTFGRFSVHFFVVNSRLLTILRLKSRYPSSMDRLQKPFNPYKHLKEEFVSNLNGSSMLEIAALSFIVPALFLLRHWSMLDSSHVIKNDHVNAGLKDWRNFLVTLAVDFTCIVLPILLIFTVLAEWVYEIAICLALLLVFILTTRSKPVNVKERIQPVSSIRANISSYRMSMMIVTCLCILAVDFKIYPRRYAKTETYGTGLMDLGVGSFVLANALVSRQARGAVSMKWKSSLQSISPLILLGFGRLIFMTGVDYQVHVGEYGVHWNFFFTLAVVSLVTAIFNVHPSYCGILGSLVLIGYQMCLTSGLNEYLLSSERATDIISLNKEGLFSVFGYWGIYLVGIQFGYSLFFGNVSMDKFRRLQWARDRVWFLGPLFWLLTVIIDKHVEQVSRRMCNLAYATFVLAQNFQVLGILMLVDFLPRAKMLMLEEAFNRNLLGSFLLANVFTGLINLFVDTLSASALMSFSILVGYAFALSFLTGVAMFSGFQLKFW